jgi:predicted nucleic acid-binding protein
MSQKPKYLLDSDLIISMLRGNPEARETFQSFIKYQDCMISVVTYVEVATGEYIRDPRISRTIRDLLDPIAAIDFNRGIAQKAAKIHAQIKGHSKQMGLGDLQIAATASFSRRILVTRNISHFALFADQDKQLELMEW